MSEPLPHAISLLFRIQPEEMRGLMRLREHEAEKSESESILNYLGEVLLRCLQIVTTPADQRHPKDSAFLAEVAKELKHSVSVTAEDGQKILFRFL